MNKCCQVSAVVHSVGTCECLCLFVFVRVCVCVFLCMHACNYAPACLCAHTVCIYLHAFICLSFAHLIMLPYKNSVHPDDCYNR